jgi:fermentation-respiration switch protein FrsA (DUF1100 family)
MWRMLMLLIPVGALFLALWFGQRRLIYFPDSTVPPPDRVGLSNAETVSFSTDDGLRLESWFVAPTTPEASPTTVVFLPGNAGSRAMRAALAGRLADRGVQTLLVDYRGYGGNPGSPSEQGLALDARAARRYLLGRPDVDPRRLVIFGESLGTGVAVRLASEALPMALVLRSPYTSLADVGRRHYPFLPMFLLRDTFSSIERMPHVTCPVLVIAARHDSIVPTPLSERLFAVAPASTKRLLIVDNVDHNDHELLAGPTVVNAVVDFISTQRPGG